MYQVVTIDGRSGEVFRSDLYLWTEEAERKQEAVLHYFPDDDTQIVEVETGALPGQRVYATGWQLCYQFNRDSMGSRTFRRKVIDIVVGDTKAEGRAVIQGETYTVIRWRSDILKSWHVCTGRFQKGGTF